MAKQRNRAKRVRSRRSYQRNIYRDLVVASFFVGAFVFTSVRFGIQWLA